MNTTSTTVSNPSANIDAASVAGLLESLLNTQPRVTTADLASTAGISAAKAKTLLIGFYGDQVQFKRGRTGGIVLTGAIAPKVDVESVDADPESVDADPESDASDYEVDSFSDSAYDSFDDSYDDESEEVID